MGFRKFIDWMRLGWRLNRVESAIEKERLMGYDPWKSIGKGFWAFVKSSLSVIAVVGIPALFNYWTPDQIANALRAAGASPLLIAAGVPLVHALLSAFQNWYKNSQKP